MPAAAVPRRRPRAFVAAPPVRRGPAIAKIGLLVAVTAAGAALAAGGVAIAVLMVLANIGG
jgi:hypothetical protein